MWKTVAKLLTTAHAVVGYSIILSSYLANFPVSSSRIEQSVEALWPLGSALMPWIVWGGLIFCLVVLATRLLAWIVDRLNDGPSVRRFHNLTQRLRFCRSILVSLHDFGGFLPEGERASRYSEALWEAGLTMKELEELRIPIPESTRIPDKESLIRLIGYFTAMEALAANGQLRHARISDANREG